ncbi:MAG: DUF1080 domain-containing protein [Akkermansiaceae bacterium]|jgi:hypothetical protein|nr:DUF1080 domain-containing protein [Akkermansiaceae bacterium]
MKPAALLLVASLFGMVSPCLAKPDSGRVWTDPEQAAKEDPDFGIQGEYSGKGTGVQIIAMGAGRFDAWVMAGGLPGAGALGERLLLQGQTKEGRVDFRSGDGKHRATLEGKKLELSLSGKGPMILRKIDRRSPSLGAKPPEDAVVLFDGGDASEWVNGKVENGFLMASGATTKRKFSSYRLHLEFRTPYMPDARGQARGNSGVYHSGRWETQILDSFGLEGRDNECGGIYSISKPMLHLCLPPLSWQTYDVEFVAAKFDADGKRVAWPRITVKLNGIVVHEDLELNKDFTTSAPITSPLVDPQGPIFLQNHGNPVAFRNIWVVPMD